MPIRLVSLLKLPCTVWIPELKELIERQQYALGVFLDIEGAFDNASVQSLQSVLHSKGVSRTIIYWISFMLSCRSATASLGNVELCVALLKGFPQGGVLSALFWIFIADNLLAQINGCRYDSQRQADDFSILAEGADLDTVCSKADNTFPGTKMG